MAAIPPAEKIFEAWSAIESNRINLISGSYSGSGEAEVISSNGEKTYLISWEGNKYTSNDNATWWQGYAGYPVLAILMLQGKLPFDKDIAHLFMNIDWHSYNKEAKGNYEEALKKVFKELQLSGEEEKKILEAARESINKFMALDITTGRYKKLQHGDY